jgi:hypothetical protein
MRRINKNAVVNLYTLLSHLKLTVEFSKDHGPTFQNGVIHIEMTTYEVLTFCSDVRYAVNIWEGILHELGHFFAAPISCIK